LRLTFIMHPRLNLNLLFADANRVPHPVLSKRAENSALRLSSSQQQSYWLRESAAGFITTNRDRELVE
jgi:hypothetical protein